MPSCAPSPSHSCAPSPFSSPLSLSSLRLCLSISLSPSLTLPLFLSLSVSFSRSPCLPPRPRLKRTPATPPIGRVHELRDPQAGPHAATPPAWPHAQPGLTPSLASRRQGKSPQAQFTAQQNTSYAVTASHGLCSHGLARAMQCLCLSLAAGESKLQAYDSHVTRGDGPIRVT